MTDVVFNADDLGMGAGVDEGIAACVGAGLVREVSACAAGPTVREGVEQVRASSPDAGIGLHLSLTYGRALSGPLRGLTDRHGVFHGLPRVLAACVLRRPDPHEIERELRAQLAALRALDVEPSHLDGHHHVHAFPVVREALIRVLSEEGPMHVRIPLDRGSGGRRRSPRVRLIEAFAARLATELRGLSPSLPFVGHATYRSEDFRRTLLDTARELPGPAVEWMVHPARVERRGEQEIAALVDPAVHEALEALGVRARRYRDVTSS